MPARAEPDLLVVRMEDFAARFLQGGST